MSVQASQQLLVALVVIPTAMVVIALFAVMWRERTTPRSAWIAGLSGLVLAAWTITTGVLASSGFYQPPDTRSPPPVGIQLVIALAVLAVCLWLSPTLRGLLRNQKNLIRLNVWRLEGVLFLALMFTGQVPALWAIPAGVGDVLIGATAFWVAARLDEPGGRRRAVIFNLLGLLDLVVAIGLGIATNPGPVQIFHTTPSAELLTRFPLALVPGFLVPLAFMVHFVSLWQLSRRSAAGLTANS
jgi:hypothetical protein